MFASDFFDVLDQCTLEQFPVLTVPPDHLPGCLTSSHLLSRVRIRCRSNGITLSSSGASLLMYVRLWMNRGVSPRDRCQTYVTAGSYVVIDNALGEQFCGALRAELQWLAVNNLMQKNQTQFTTPDGPKQFSKPGIFEVSTVQQLICMDLHGSDCLSAYSTVSSVACWQRQ